MIQWRFSRRLDGRIPHRHRPPRSLSSKFSFDPESEAGRKVIDKINERVAEASKKQTSDGVASSKGVPAEGGGGLGGTGGDDTASSSADTPVTQFAKQIPALHLKLESRACGLFAAWVRDTVILIDAMGRAEEM